MASTDEEAVESQASHHVAVAAFQTGFIKALEKPGQEAPRDGMNRTNETAHRRTWIQKKTLSWCLACTLVKLAKAEGVSNLPCYKLDSPLLGAERWQA